MRLTDLQIKKLVPPNAGQKTYYDDLLPGFGVRVSQGGAKSFVVMFGPRRQLKTLGRYPTVSLADARLAAKRVQSDVALLTNDPNPFVEISFSEAKERFLQDSRRRNKPSTTKEYQRLLGLYFPFDKKLAAISTRDLSSAIDKVGAPSEAQHAFVAVRTMLNWCLKHRLIDRSPLPLMTFKTTSRDRVLSDQELTLVWHRALEFGFPYGPLVQLLVLTGQRRGETAALRRSWIEDSTIEFPERITKNKRLHRIPFGPSVDAVLDELPDDTDLLFPARGKPDTTISGWSKFKKRFDRPLSVEPYTLHDLRRTYSSTMARLGVPIHVTERLLNHSSGTVSGVAAIYNRYDYAAEMREAVSRYEDHLFKLFSEQA